MGNCMRGSTPRVSPDTSSNGPPHSERGFFFQGKFRYRREEKLGRGTFGEVFSATQLPAYKKVAIKCVSEKHGKREEEMLLIFSGIDPAKRSIVPLLESFAHDLMYCLVFDKLDMDLSKYMQHHRFEVSQIRAVVQQLLVALQTLKSCGVVHADIKSNNIMFVDHKTQPFKVLLIDFGVAKRLEEMKTPVKIQVLANKAPEILLGLRGDEAVDMWALGSVLARMFIGSAKLFPTHCPYEYLRAIIQMLGQPPDEMLEAAPFRSMFFADAHARAGDAACSPRFRLYTPREFVEENHTFTYERPSVYTNCSSISDLPRFRQYPKSQAEREDMSKLISLLKKMLNVDRAKRITPDQGLQHKFITMSHFADRRREPYVRAALGHMRVCQSVTGKELFAPADAQPLKEAWVQLCAPRNTENEMLGFQADEMGATRVCCCGSAKSVREVL